MALFLRLNRLRAGRR